MTPPVVIQIILCLAFLAMIGLVFYLLDEREKARKNESRMAAALREIAKKQAVFTARVDSEQNPSLSSGPFKDPPS